MAIKYAAESPDRFVGEYERKSEAIAQAERMTGHLTVIVKRYANDDDTVGVTLAVYSEGKETWHRGKK